VRTTDIWESKFRRKDVLAHRWNWFLVYFETPSISQTTSSAEVKNEWSFEYTGPTPWRREGNFTFYVASMEG
jgi:hypothetical protein